MYRFLATTVLLLVLAGCASKGGLPPGDEAEQRWQAQQQALVDFEDWNLRARAVLRLEGEAYQVGLSWRRDADRFVLLLEAPFGQGVIRIDRDPAGAYRLALPDGRVFYNDSAEALMDELLGWSIPISGLEYWIRGLPHPDSDYTRRAADSGATRSLRQDRWDIDYLDYFAEQPPLPKRLNLGRDDIALKLVVEHWQPAQVEDDSPGLFPEFN